MAKQIVYGEQARQAVLRGINQLADAARLQRAIWNSPPIGSICGACSSRSGMWPPAEFEARYYEQAAVA